MTSYFSATRHPWSSFLFLLPLLAACDKPADPPPALSFARAVLVPMDRLGSCLGNAFVPDYRTEYQPFPQDRRARFFVYRPATASLPNPQPIVIELKQGPDDTVVGFNYPPDGQSADTERARQAIVTCGGTSACIEPIPANIYTHKTLSGSFVVKNPYLEKLLQAKSKDSTNVWNSILEHGGSVQHLDFLSPEEKAVYKTSFEIDQRWLLEFAADRTPYIDQAQSLNLFIPADVEKWDLLMLHFRAWELGIKSLYYLRSKSVQHVKVKSVDRTAYLRARTTS